MEGYLYRRTRSNHAWVKRWFLLEDSTLTYYEDLNKKKRDSFSIDCNWHLKRITAKDRRHAFILTHEDENSLYLSAENDYEMDLWMEQLRDLIRSTDPKSFDFHSNNGQGYYQILNMHNDMARGLILTAQDLTKYYHDQVKQIMDRARRTNFADDDEVDLEEQVHEAKRAYYELSKKHFEVNKYDFRHFKYEVTLTKNSEGKLGLTLAESPRLGRVVIRDIDRPNLTKSCLSNSAKGDMSTHDAIVAIDNELVHTWTLPRIVQRLNEFRLKKGESIKIEFAREYFATGQEVVEKENLHDEFILYEHIKDREKETESELLKAAPVRVQPKQRSSIFNWAGIDPSQFKDDNDDDGDDSGQGDLPAAGGSKQFVKKVDKRRRSVLSSLTSGFSSYSDDMETAPPMSTINEEPNDTQNVPSPSPPSSHEVSSTDSISAAKHKILEAEVERLNSDNFDLECQVKKLNKKIKEEEDAIKNINTLEMKVETIEEENELLLQQVDGLEKELKTLRGLVSNRKYPLSASGFSEKMKRLQERVGM